MRNFYLTYLKWQALPAILSWNLSLPTLHWEGQEGDYLTNSEPTKCTVCKEKQKYFKMKDAPE